MIKKQIMKSQLTVELENLPINNFIDFLKKYHLIYPSHLDDKIIDDFICDVKHDSVWKMKEDNNIFKTLNQTSMCNEAKKIYEVLKEQYYDFLMTKYIINYNNDEY